MSITNELSKDHPLKNTSIGQLIEEGYSNTDFSAAIGCASNTVSAWRSGKYPSGTMQQKATNHIKERDDNKAIMENLMESYDHASVHVQNDALVSIPAHKLEKFKKLMSFGGFDYVMGD